MARFTAPAHTSEVFLPSGPARVVEGFVTLDNPTEGDLRGLAAAGFTVADEKPASKPVQPPVTEKE